MQGARGALVSLRSLQGDDVSREGSGLEDAMTEQEARTAGLVQLTEWAFPASMVETVRGSVEYAEWIRYEGERIKCDGRRVETVEDGRRIALFGQPSAHLKPERFLSERRTA